MTRTIDNPILNSPYEEPSRHFAFDQEGITGEIVEERRISGYFVPVPPPKKKGKQLQLDLETGWTDRWEASPFINRVRERVAVWRRQRWPGVTGTTARLLAHWTDPTRERRLFFCQLEAVETAIYLAEVADKAGDGWVATSLREANEAMNPGLFRVALKMATGSGKTVVMGMLIAWQALNKLASSQDARFSDTFLIVTPGITIRDRLRVLLPSDPETYYRQLDLVPPDLFQRLGSARIVITNYHSFLRREKVAASRITKAVATRGDSSAFVESEGEMVRRVCRELGAKRNVVVLNDEAHHCYRPKAKEERAQEALTGQDRKEAEERDKQAQVWLSGLEAVQRKLGVRAVYDLSATPFFLRGSGYDEGKLFPWVVSDFSLIDAIESGIVKVPRVPVADDSMVGDLPTYRDLWVRIREHLPKRTAGTKRVAGTPVLPKELEGAIDTLYSSYRKSFEAWENDSEAVARGATPPVFIAVCNNTNVSKLVFDHLSGYEKLGPDGEPLVGPDGRTVLVPSDYPIFSNVTEEGRWVTRPRSILVDSEQLESDEPMSPEFRKAAAAEIEEWKQEVRVRFPGRDVEQLSEKDLLREVMNTVGKPGKLGENVRCVVSVSMLTEGWDANTVTHILGIRAFRTQLLCEQVVGRGLRRRSYAVNDEGHFVPEYAEVYGVPFSFIPTSGTDGEAPTTQSTTRVRFLEDRASLDIRFPRIDGYRFEIGAAPLSWTWTPESKLSISTADVPTRVENAPMVGEISIHDLEDLKHRRLQEVDFRLARLLHQRRFPDQPWRFPELLRVVRAWRSECLELKDRVFPQYLLFVEIGMKAVERIGRALSAEGTTNPRLLPIAAPYDPVGTCRHVDFPTVKSVWPTRADKSPVSHAVCDTRDWEEKVAESLEGVPEVLSYVKNERLGFEIPYELGGEKRAYRPDFLVRWDDGRGADDPLHLVVEVSGEKLEEKEAKVATARDLWVPAVNNAGTWGRWAFYEIHDPWSCQKELRSFVLSLSMNRVA
ncbi:MAG: hypothetical protein AMXMBFR36_16650 [Acidobacteriota bacterium]